MPNEFEIDAYRNGRELYIVLRGRLVLSGCQDAKTRLGNLLTSQTDLMYLAMSELTFLDSAGLGVMVGIKMNANKSHTRLVLLSPPQRIQDIFRVSKLDTIFDIRSGAEADLIATRFKSPEYCLWRDSKDDRQVLYNTEADYIPRNQMTQLTMVDGGGGENDSRVRQLCDEAVEFIRQGEYLKAIENYRRALNLDPNNLSALNNLGIVYEKRAEWYSQAVEIWRRVLDLSEHDHDEKHAGRARKHLETLSKLMRV
jgi:anti-sigma B factor antagonist